MGRLSDEMVSLRVKMRKLSAERKRLVFDLGSDSERRRQETHDMLSAFRRERQATTGPFLQELKQQRQQNVQFVQNLQNEAVQLRTGFRRELDETARLRRESIKASVSERRDATAQKLASWRRERHKTSARLREELAAFRAGMLAAMPDFQTLAAERHCDVKNIRQDVQDLLQTSRQGLAEMAQNGRSERLDFINALRQEVAEISQNVQAMRTDMIAELSTIRQALNGTLEPQQRPAPSVTRDASAPADLGPGQPMPAFEPADDLTLINGIGAVRARLLQASGVRTFAQLAKCTVEELQTMINSPIISAEIPKWIDAAARLGAQK